MMPIAADQHIIQPHTGSGWNAGLELEFSKADAATRLTGRRHYGPLRVQKPLYPEGEDICHAVIVHPPGGIVSGDQLQISVQVQAGAQALLTTPGASKWYRSMGQAARQSVHLRLARDAVLEWLPQESIFFDQSDARMEQVVELEEGARYLGGEILCFGRTGSGEQFRSGRLHQSSRIRRGDRLIWVEQGELLAGSEAMSSPQVLHEYSVCALLLACGASLSPEAMETLRNLAAEAGVRLDDRSLSGFSQNRSLVCGRFLGHSSEAARAWLLAAWSVLRPLVCGRPAVVPRIWQT